MQGRTCRTSGCATYTKRSDKHYIVCRNPHLTKQGESGRIFKVARAAGSTETWAEANRKKSKFCEKILKNLLTKQRCCDIIIRLSRK